MSKDASRGFSIRIFLPEGSADGVRVVEKSNWTGICLMCPRSRFSTVRERQELGRTGIYVLVGPTSGESQLTIYIGQGDPVRPRLDQHNAKKDFWTSLIAFTSKDANLNKAHVEYLEARLVTLAQEAKRCQLDNVNTPQLPSLSEPDTADMNTYLEEMLRIFPVLGVTVFQKPESAPPERQVLHIERKGIEARGYEAAQGFVVLADSQAVVAHVPSASDHMVALRNSLREKGLLAKQARVYVFTQDYTFDSPSLAACVVLGSSANGRIEWKTKDGVTLKEIQSATVDDAQE